MAEDLRGDEKSPSKGRRDGITCWVPECFNNSSGNTEINCIFSQEHALREKSIEHIERENFILTSHRVYSVHFGGGKKYLLIAH